MERNKVGNIRGGKYIEVEDFVENRRKWGRGGRIGGRYDWTRFEESTS
jgi:hypothetical protein